MKILTSLVTGGVVLIFLGVALAIGVMINQDVGKASFSTLSGNVLNEVVSANNESDVVLLLTGASINKQMTGCTSVTNDTTGLPYVATTDYVCSSNGNFHWVNASDPVVSVNVNYSVSWENWNTVYNASYQGQMGLANLAGWNKTIATVIAAVIILGLIISGLGGFIYLKGGNI